MLHWELESDPGSPALACPGPSIIFIVLSGNAYSTQHVCGVPSFGVIISCAIRSLSGPEGFENSSEKVCSAPEASAGDPETIVGGPSAGAVPPQAVMRRIPKIGRPNRH